MFCFRFTIILYVKTTLNRDWTKNQPPSRPRNRSHYNRNDLTYRFNLVPCQFKPNTRTISKIFLHSDTKAPAELVYLYAIRTEVFRTSESRKSMTALRSISSKVSRMCHNISIEL